MSVSSRRRPRRQRRGGRGPLAVRSLRARPLCFGPGLGAGRRALLCAGPRAGPCPAVPCWAAAGLSRRQAPGRLHFVRGAGRGARPGARGAPERPLCLPHPGGGGGRWARAAGDALSGAVRAPRSRGGGSPRGTSGLAVPGPLRAYNMQPSGGWRAPDLPRRWEWSLGGFGHPCLVCVCWGGCGGRREGLREQRITEHPQIVLMPEVLQQDYLI